MAKKIMIVDDTQDIREAVKVILENKGYEVVIVKSGDECITQLEEMERKPDLVLLDVMMPGMAAKEVISKLRGIKVLYLTVVALQEAEKEDLLEEENVVGFIHKPFSAKDLVARIDGILN